MGEEIRHVNGVELCCETYGALGHPCVLMMMGAMASMLSWDSEFCMRIAKAGRFVIRYDNRDTGRSTCGPPGQIAYGVDDLVDDAIAILDDYRVTSAHLVGMSLGGMIAQVAALRFPERVTAITVVASGIWDDRPELGVMDPSIIDYHASAAQLDWESEEDVIEYLVGGERLLCGLGRSFDVEAATTRACRVVRRARSLPSMFNHALLGGGEEWFGRVGAIRCPVAVLHGTDDRVLPMPHAEALIAEVPEASLTRLEGAGHELHRDDWPRILRAILRT